MLIIPIQPVPSQQVLCVLNGQNCQIAIYLRNKKIYVDLNSNGTNMCLACLAHNAVPLDACNSYDGFQGNLFFIDTQGIDDPQYTGFNTRWFLVYLTPAELLLTNNVPPSNIEAASILTLSATLTVTAPAPGNFSVAHGLGLVPFLIEIIPTAAGAIWGQAGFADGTNINLVASDTGVTATILVYTETAAGLTVQTPARTLLVDSPGSGDFTVAHGLGAVPSMVEILPTSAGAIWGQAPLFDGTNVYLAASDAGQTAIVSVYAPVTDALNLAAPATILSVTAAAPGAFSVAHDLSSVPSRIEILMISSGVIWAQTPAFDGTNVYLEASDSGVIAKISVYA
jgi:hypothetical protein